MKMLPGRIGVGHKRSIFKRAKRGLQMYFGTGRYNVRKRSEHAQALYARSAVRNAFIRRSPVALLRTNKRIHKVAGMINQKAIRYGLRRIGAGYAVAIGGSAGASYSLNRRSRKRAAATHKTRQFKRRG